MSQGLHQRLRAEARAQTADRPGLTLTDVLQLHGDASLAGLLLVLSVLTVLPLAAAGTVISLALVALAWAWARGHERATLPARLGGLRLNGRWSGRCLHTLAWIHEQAHRCMRPRWSLWSHRHTRGLWGGWIALMAAIIFLPLPLGNLLPSASLVLLSLGWMFRDGLVLIVSTALGVAAMAYTVSLGHVVTALLQRAWGWLPW